MESLKPETSILADAISVVIRDEEIIQKQKIVIVVLSVICAMLAVISHGKKSA